MNYSAILMTSAWAYVAFRRFEMNTEFDGKSLIVTGASSGMGVAVAQAFAAAGASVYLGARRETEGEEVARRIRAGGGKAQFVRTDVTREADVKRLVDTVVQRHGRLDVAFNNAGTDGVFSPFVDQSNENYDLVMNTNVKGLFWSMRYEIEAMLRTGGGAIVNNSSMGAFIGFQQAAVYVASKHAVMGLTKTAALEYFPRGIRINAINPGLIDTPFQDRVWGDEAKKQGFANASAAGRIGRSEEMAGPVLFLASSQASFLSGHGLVVDGGYIVQ
jgi:NAD(P)-dependent dehydrogenase (short-subunit alcohol dehydrogenase family)